MSAAIPKTMRALAQNKSAGDFEMKDAPFSGNFHPEMQASVQEVPVPELEENDILIKVHYAAQASPCHPPPGGGPPIGKHHR